MEFRASLKHFSVELCESSWHSSVEECLSAKIAPEIEP